jgi:hypothetical protein
VRRIAITAVSILGATFVLVASAGPALANNLTPGQKTPTTTTLDACGYFTGVSTANKTTQSGTFYTDKGTWTGVSNNYYDTPVASLGTVTGSYTDSGNLDPSTGAITGGTEVFRSDAGSITQSYAFDPATGWHVSVAATGSLSFLTSSTNGACYMGTFPRS